MNPPAPRRWPVRWLIVLLLAFALAAVPKVLIYLGISQIGHAPVSIVIDGDEVLQGLDLGAMSSPHKLVIAGIVTLLALVAMVVLPVILAVGLMLMLVAVLAAVSVPMLAVALVLAIVFSPLLLGLGLLWWLLRRPGPRSQSPPPAGAATMR
jgi:hypothetical protein